MYCNFGIDVYAQWFSSNDYGVCVIGPLSANVFRGIEFLSGSSVSATQAMLTNMRYKKWFLELWSIFCLARGVKWWTPRLDQIWTSYYRLGNRAFKLWWMYKVSRWLSTFTLKGSTLIRISTLGSIKRLTNKNTQHAHTHTHTNILEYLHRFFFCESRSLILSHCIFSRTSNATLTIRIQEHLSYYKMNSESFLFPASLACLCVHFYHWQRKIAIERKWNTFNSVYIINYAVNCTVETQHCLWFETFSFEISWKYPFSPFSQPSPFLYKFEHFGFCSQSNMDTLQFRHMLLSMHYG